MVEYHSFDFVLQTSPLLNFSNLFYLFFELISILVRTFLSDVDGGRINFEKAIVQIWEDKKKVEDGGGTVGCKNKSERQLNVNKWFLETVENERLKNNYDDPF